jgi:hypothetical protein
MATSSQWHDMSEFVVHRGRRPCAPSRACPPLPIGGLVFGVGLAWTGYSMWPGESEPQTGTTAAAA